MELMKNIGLVEILENGEIFLPGLHQMVGSESQWAKYKKKNGKYFFFSSSVLGTLEFGNTATHERTRISTHWYSKSQSGIKPLWTQEKEHKKGGLWVWGNNIL